MVMIGFLDMGGALSRAAVQCKPLEQQSCVDAVESGQFAANDPHDWKFRTAPALSCSHPNNRR
jgi:hypothetical protein